MKRQILTTLAALLIIAAPAIAVANYPFKYSVQFNKAVTCLTTLAVTGATTLTGAVTHAGTTTHTGAVTNSSTATTTGVHTFTVEPTFTVPLKAASVNTSVKRDSLPIQVNGGSLLVDGTTYTHSIGMTRAGTIKAINGTAVVLAAGGTSTIAFAKKQGATTVNLLSTATVDPTAFPTAADTAEAMTLTATGADLIFASGDTLKLTYVTGTQTTNSDGVSFTLDVEYTDI